MHYLLVVRRDYKFCYNTDTLINNVDYCGVGGAFQDAVGVCAHELGDPQLALFLARLLEGEQGPLQQALLTKELLPGQPLLRCPQYHSVNQSCRHSMCPWNPSGC